MKNPNYSIGDIVYMREGFCAKIVGIRKGWFGTKYVCVWTVNVNGGDVDNYKYTTSGYKREWQIMCKKENHEE